LKDHLSRIDSLGWQGATRDAAQAGLFAEDGLYADAAESYLRALATPRTELRVTLADVYLVSGLTNLAEARYREALRDAPPPVQASALFGLGRVAYTRGQFQEAAEQFQKARKLYAELKLDEEEAAALRAEKSAASRVPK